MQEKRYSDIPYSDKAMNTRAAGHKALLQTS